MINIKHILSLSPDERDDVIRELIAPKPWKHKRCEKEGIDFCFCVKCGKDLTPYGTIHENCPIPDPILLDWNLAMKMFREEDRLILLVRAMCKIYDARESSRESFSNWWLHFAQPHHYILAACMTKESK